MTTKRTKQLATSTLALRRANDRLSVKLKYRTFPIVRDGRIVGHRAILPPVPSRSTTESQ